mmetsp:Transcript_39269/g.113511  ORF Transcript_39269/g.113511 Transcript_39269/m.113511 type:complete len:364 (-) Transcript_39269:275-1366(-)
MAAHHLQHPQSPQHASAASAIAGPSPGGSRSENVGGPSPSVAVLMTGPSAPPQPAERRSPPQSGWETPERERRAQAAASAGGGGVVGAVSGGGGSPSVLERFLRCFGRGGNRPQPAAQADSPQPAHRHRAADQDHYLHQQRGVGRQGGAYGNRHNEQRGYSYNNHHGVGNFGGEYRGDYRGGGDSREYRSDYRDYRGDNRDYRGEYRGDFRGGVHDGFGGGRHHRRGLDDRLAAQLQLAREARQARELQEQQELELALHRSMEQLTGPGDDEGAQARAAAAEREQHGHMLNGLPHEKYSAEHHKQLVECELCLVDYVDGDELLRLPCMHFFHAGCVMPWLQKSNTCPMCQTDVYQAIQAAGSG